MNRLIMALAASTSLAFAASASAETSTSDFGMVADAFGWNGLTPVEPIDGPMVLPPLFPPIEEPPIYVVGGCAVVLVPFGYICIDDPSRPGGVIIVKAWDTTTPIDIPPFPDEPYFGYVPPVIMPGGELSGGGFMSGNLLPGGELSGGSFN